MSCKNNLLQYNGRKFITVRLTALLRNKGDYISEKCS